MRSKRTSPEEQLRLITECHQSGQTDHEWCEQHNIKISTFYTWIHRLKQSGGIDIPAVLPTVVRKEAEHPDIVKIKIEGERSAAAVLKPTHIPAPESPEETLHATQTQPGCPVMEVIIRGVHLRVTNDINPNLLAETIRLLRSTEC